jgi:hypothetical protein
VGYSIAQRMAFAGFSLEYISTKVTEIQRNKAAESSELAATRDTTTWERIGVKSLREDINGVQRNAYIFDNTWTEQDFQELKGQ